MSVVENMSDAEVLALSNVVIATLSADLANHPPLTEADLSTARAKREDLEDKLLAHDQAQAAALAATTPTPIVPTTVDTSERLHHTINFADASAEATGKADSLGTPDRDAAPNTQTNAAPDTERTRPRSTLGCEIWVNLDDPTNETAS